MLLAQGWRASATAAALERDPHTIGRWAAAFGEGGPRDLIFEQTGGSPRPWRGAAGGVEGGGAAAACRGGHGPGQLELEGGASVCLGTLRPQPVPQQLPDLPPSTRGQALRRLGFAFKRPKKRLLKADEEKREAFVAAYAALREEAVGSGAKIFFADEAHFRAVRSCGAGGCCGESQPPVFTGAGSGELQQSAVWRESQLLFGGVSGDGRGGMDGPGGKQQQRNLGSLFGPVGPEALWAASGNLG